MITTSTRVEDADIASLLERVTAAAGPDRVLDLDLALALVPDVVVLRRNDDDTANEPHTYWEYTTSIDAALALVERMLPGWKWQFYSEGVYGAGGIVASLMEPAFAALSRKGRPYRHAEGTGPTLAIAILIAALRSLSQGAGHEQ